MKKLFYTLIAALFIYSSSIYSQIILQDEKWETGQTVKILLMNGGEAEHDLFKKAVGLWAQYVNLNFEFHTLDEEPIIFPLKFRKDTVRVMFDNKILSHSKVGNTYDLSLFEEITYMKIGYSPISKIKFFSTAVHEFGHALGLLHEHQHPEMERSITHNEMMNMCKYLMGLDVSTEEGANRCKLNLGGIPQEDIEEYNMDLSEFDADSVMLYAEAYEGSKGFFNKSLSLGDKLFIAKHYPFDNPLTKEEITKMHNEDREAEMQWILKEYNTPQCKLEFINEDLYMAGKKGDRVVKVKIQEQTSIDNYFPACSRVRK